ncbi:hypothetical protein RFI_26661, partial [Reticulomyxa filosa]
MKVTFFLFSPKILFYDQRYKYQSVHICGYHKIISTPPFSGSIHKNDEDVLYLEEKSALTPFDTHDETPTIKGDEETNRQGMAMALPNVTMQELEQLQRLQAIVQSQLDQLEALVTIHRENKESKKQGTNEKKTEANQDVPKKEQQQEEDMTEEEIFDALKQTIQSCRLQIKRLRSNPNEVIVE